MKHELNTDLRDCQAAVTLHSGFFFFNQVHLCSLPHQRPPETSGLMHRQEGSQNTSSEPNQGGREGHDSSVKAPPLRPVFGLSWTLRTLTCWRAHGELDGQLPHGGHVLWLPKIIYWKHRSVSMLRPRQMEQGEILRS